MAGRKPDFDVLVAVNYTDTQGQERTHWHNVGSGWSGDNGSISFNIVTCPGVAFVAARKQEKQKDKAA